MRLVKNYLYNAFFQIFILFVPLVTTPYLARVLGPKGVGINSYTASITQYFVLFGSIGVNLYANRQIAFVRDDRKQLTTTFYEIFLMRLFTISLASTAFAIFISLIDEYQLYYWAQFLTIVAAGFDISWFFMGMENFSVTVLRNIFVKIVTLICIFVFVRTSQDLAMYIFILSMSMLCGNLLLFPSLVKYIGKPDFDRLKIFRHLLPSLVLFLPQIATQIYLVLNKTMLGSMISVQAAGFFDQSDKMIKIILAIVTATGTVMLPHVANTFVKGDVVKTKQFLYGSFQFVTALSVPMAFGLIAIAPKFVPLFFSRRFLDVVPIMMIEACVIILIAWSNSLGIQYLLPTRQNRAFTISVILGAAVNLVANVPLILKYGAVGAAIATVLSEIAVTSFQLFVIRKQIDYRKLFADNGKCLLAGSLMFVMIFFLDRLLANNWWALVLEVSGGIVFYILLLLIFKVKILLKAKMLLTR